MIEFLTGVIDSSRVRNYGTPNVNGMIANLSKRIESAEDEGLKSVVHWHQWLSYSQAVECLDQLKRIIDIHGSQ